jgi:hypothetical protein
MEPFDSAGEITDGRDDADVGSFAVEDAGLADDSGVAFVADVADLVAADDIAPPVREAAAVAPVAGFADAEPAKVCERATTGFVVVGGAMDVRRDGGAGAVAVVSFDVAPDFEATDAAAAVADVEGFLMDGVELVELIVAVVGFAVDDWDVDGLSEPAPNLPEFMIWCNHAANARCEHASRWRWGEIIKW